MKKTSFILSGMVFQIFGMNNIIDLLPDESAAKNQNELNVLLNSKNLKRYYDSNSGLLIDILAKVVCKEFLSPIGTRPEKAEEIFTLKCPHCSKVLSTKLRPQVLKDNMCAHIRKNHKAQALVSIRQVLETMARR